MIVKKLKFKQKTIKALKWIIGILNKHKTDYQISGGFAAKLYDSDRELVDIDIDIPDNKFNNMYDDVKDYIIYGPKKYKDRNWDLKLMTLDYNGQTIDISGKAKIFDKNSQKWVIRKVDFSKSDTMKIDGIDVSVISKEDLISYKSKLLRRVDRQDIKNLSN